jgi:hypothetical protein
LYVQNPRFSARRALDGAICLPAAREKRLVGSAQTPKMKEERLLKNEVQKQKKKYKRKGQRKEVLFKDDEWEIVKRNADRMGLDTSKYIVMMSLNGNNVPSDVSELAELSRQLSRIGNCINQLARKANTINSIYAEDYERMKEENARLCLTLNRAIFMLRRTAA